MTEIMPFPENNIILFYWTAPKWGAFLCAGTRTHKMQMPGGHLPGAGLDGGCSIT